MPSPPAAILIYGRDRQLLETRCWVLEGAGARVWSATCLSDFDRVGAANATHSSDVSTPTATVDLVILCHSLSLEDCGRALALAGMRWPQARSLLLTQGRFGGRSDASDQVADATQGPAYLLDRVAKVIPDRHINLPAAHNRITGAMSHGKV